MTANDAGDCDGNDCDDDGSAHQRNAAYNNVFRINIIIIYRALMRACYEREI